MGLTGRGPRGPPHKGPKLLVGWRYAALWGGLVTAIGLAIYPVVVSPFMNPEEWRQISKETRDKHGIKQEDIQPGNMKVWTDPFDRQGKPGNK